VNKRNKTKVNILFMNISQRFDKWARSARRSWASHKSKRLFINFNPFFCKN